MNQTMNILLIEKDCSISEKNIKSNMLNKLYSVCGYRTNKDFEKINEWIFDENIYELYGKKSGKKDKENNFKFPHINDTFYGSLCVVKKNGSLSLDEWNMFYMSFTESKEYTNDIESERESERESESNESIDSHSLSYHKSKFAKLHDMNEVDEVNSEMNREIELTYEDYEEEI